MRRFPVFSLVVAFCVLLFVVAGGYEIAKAITLAIDFETPTYSTGTIHNQDGWSSLGSAGSGSPNYDHAVVANTYGYVSFGLQSLRMSNAVTSGSFGDQTFSKSIPNEAGETSAQNDGFSGGTRQPFFEAQWDFASTVPGAEQPGLSVVASPDRGDGARMSWIQMTDTPSGLEVNFYDYQKYLEPSYAFVLTNVASGLNRAVPHSIKVQMYFVDGPENDVVKVFVDNVLVHTGTSWEDYFPAQEGKPTRTVDSILFRTSGVAAPATTGNGFLIDNLALTSSTVTQCTTTCYVDAVNGSDGYGGTSIADAKKTIQAAVNQVSPGGQVIVAAGTYNEAVVVPKSLTLQGATSDKTQYLIDGTGLGSPGSGIYINNGVTGVTIQDLTVQDFVGNGPNSFAGIYATGGNNNLTVTNTIIKDNVGGSGIYANGPVNNVLFTNNTISGHPNTFGNARGIVIWNGLKSNITITGNMVTNNACCGIELQDGTASAVNISNNTIDIGSGDNAIGVVGLNTVVGANIINSNIITGGGRFGIEIKNPAGGVTVSGNQVTLSTQNADLRDRAGIAILRRGVLAGNVDVPNGVTITANTVTGYQQTTTSEGFGIVVEGTNHVVTGNTLRNNEVGILQQQNCRTDTIRATPTTAT